MSLSPKTIWTGLLAAALSLTATAGWSQEAKTTTGPVPTAAPAISSAPVTAPLATKPVTQARQYPKRSYRAYYKARRAAAPAAAGLTATAIATPVKATPALSAPVTSTQPARPGARLAPGTAIPPAELEAYVDGLVRRSMERDHIAGVTVSIVQNGQIVLKKGYGLAQLSPAKAVNPDQTLFRLASISKTFTWMALMKEVEAGHLRLDAPVNLYLPEKLQIKDQGFKQPILVRDLMSHTPGFEDKAMGQLFERDADRIRPLATYLRQERPDRVRESGQVSTYSNYGAALGGEISSYVSGKPFESLIEGGIIRPLGLNHTTFREPYAARADLPAPMSAALAAQVSDGFYWNGASFVPKTFEHVSQIAPAGSASSTAADMARYMQLILNGGTIDGQVIYSQATAKAFRTPLRDQTASQNGWDHGFIEYPLPGGFKGQGHEGDTLLFHSNMITVPDLNLGIFIATNTSTGDAIAASLPARIVEQYYATPTLKPFAGTPELGSQAKIYEGSYLTTRRAYSGLEKLVGSVIGEASVEVTKDGTLLLNRSGTIKAYVLSSRPGWLVNVNGVEEIKFDIVDGKAVRFYDPMATQAFERESPLTSRSTLTLFAALTALCSVAAIVGLFTRDRREFRQTPTQGRAGLMQTSIAGLWLAAMTMVGLWASVASDISQVFYSWPGSLVTLASSCALVASLLTAITLLMMTNIWRGGRRVDSWTNWRKLRFSMSTLIFTIFSILVAMRGGLEPWNS
jgi:CubicO group peptidase (beta-lactamase class C family)